MKINKIKYFLIVFAILSFSKVNSQTCGFGCLGLSGVYGGYSGQQYEADGLNDYLDIISYSVSEPKFNFKEGRGFKVGMNFVRVNYSNFFFSFKGYYQFLSESQSVEVDLMSSQLPYNTAYAAKLEMNNWGVALDLGIPLLGFIDWKIVEGELKFFAPKLTIDVSDESSFMNSSTYTPDKVKMGYSVGTGLIFNIVEDYISLEVTGMHTFIEIDYLTSDIDGSKVPTEGSDLKFISKGGLQGVIQLNVGIPL
jgi:hypothetical protein